MEAPREKISLRTSTDYEAITSFGGASIREDNDGVSGLAFKFDVVADVAIAFERISEIDYANSYVGEFKLIQMGATANNTFETIDIPAVYLCNKLDASASFAVRILEIPENHYGTVITVIPYVTYEADGVEITIYGDAQAKCYNDALNG